MAKISRLGPTQVRHMRKQPKSASCDLEKEFARLEKQLPQGKTSFTFDTKSFANIPSVISTSRVEIRKTFHFINDCWRVDVLNFRASRETYRYLGLAALAVVFCPSLPELCIRVEHPRSQIKLIRIRYEGSTPRAVFNYLTRPFSFEYLPQDVEENPWTSWSSIPANWPDFLLTFSGKRVWEHWDKRDQIEGFGSDDATVLLASLLLDFGRRRNKCPMVKLETVAGYGGVSKLSTEVRLHLPESDTWPISS